MAALLQDLGQLGEAMNMYELQIPIAREVGDRRGEAIGRLNLASLLASLGDMDAARDSLEKSLAIFEEIDAKYPQSYAHHGLGTIAWQQRRWDEAVAHLERALEMRREFEFARDIAESLRILGTVYIEQGDNELAEQRMKEAVEVARASESVVALVGTLLEGALHLDWDRQEALDTYREHAAAVGETALAILLVLWKLTGEPSYLRTARETLEQARDGAPARFRESMLDNVPIHREIWDAWDALTED